jgi:adenine/guanine phosphoribosyltransferase-like PRPP-binding protein
MRHALVTEQLAEKVRLSVEALKNHKFDTIAFSGMSGAILAPAVALKMNKALALVRKMADSSHSKSRVEGNCAVNKYVIIDDFIETGATRDYIQEMMSGFAPKAKCIGLLAVSDLAERDLEGYEKKKFPLRT